MNKPYDLNQKADRIVYVKPVAVMDLPTDVQNEVQQQTGMADKIYSVHDADGQQLALVADRNLAFTLARAHDYSAVSVH